MTCGTDFSQSSNSYFKLDGFTVYNSFLFTMSDPIESATEVRAFTGEKHVYSNYFKDKFGVHINKLTQSQANQLTQILQQTGAGALHFAEYGTPEIIRRWDAWSGFVGTSPGYTVNEDVNRIRRRIRITSHTMPHFDGSANLYYCDIECEEA